MCELRVWPAWLLHVTSTVILKYISFNPLMLLVMVGRYSSSHLASIHHYDGLQTMEK
jgi:hypothetical protein